MTQSDDISESKSEFIPQVNAPQIQRDVRTVRSHDLFGGAREIQIWHNDELYRLCITKNDKLILQK